MCFDATPAPLVLKIALRKFPDGNFARARPRGTR